MNRNASHTSAAFNIFETLESRRLLSGYSFKDAAGIHVIGSPRHDDVIVKRLPSGLIEVNVNGNVRAFTPRRLGQIEILTGRGDDSISIANDNRGIATPRRIDAGAGNDSITGGKGDDSVLCSNGDDSVNGRQGDDSLDGGLDDDTLLGGDGDDSIFGDDGNDSIEGELGDDSLHGELGDDSLDGGDGSDDLNGEDGDDSVNGDAGDDDVDGGSGADHVNGGTGHDIFHSDHDEVGERDDDSNEDEDHTDGPGHNSKELLS